MPTYTVTLVRRVYQYAEVTVPAKNREEAESLAEALGREDRVQFDPLNQLGDEEVEAINAEEH
jgi:hypothetical protein